MKKTITLTLFLTFTALQASDLVQTASTLSVSQCTNQITKAIESKKGFGVFAIIDHQKNAQKVGLTLAEQKIIIFGNPKAGTMLMQADAQVGYDLPLRIMVRSQEGKTVVEYRDPKTYASMYDLKDSPLPNKMANLLKSLAATCQ